jgi:hypothetical protein
LVLVGVIAVVPRALRDATTSAGHQREETSAESLRSTLAFVRELPAFHWLLRVSFVVIVAGTALEFGFLDILHTEFSEPSDLLTVFAGTALVGFVIGALVQTFVTPRVLSRSGAGRALVVLPVVAVGAGLLLAVGGATGWLPVAVVGIVVWRLPRWGLDPTARQAAYATLPDDRRARVSMLLDLVPTALGQILVPVSFGLATLVGGNWLVALVAAVAAAGAAVMARQITATWDDTQLSYRLKRRKRIA